MRISCDYLIDIFWQENIQHRRNSRNPPSNWSACCLAHIGSSKWSDSSVHQLIVYHCHPPIFITVIIYQPIELNCQQYSSTSHFRSIPHIIRWACLSWWDCVGWIIEQAYIDFTALMMSVHPHHLTEQSLEALYAVLYSLNGTIQSCKPLWSWCLVSSSDHAGLSCEPLPRAGGDHSLCYQNHWVHCSVTMGAKLWLAPVRQPMQLLAAVYSIPRHSMILPCGLLLFTWGLSNPLWVLFQTQRDLANVAMWAAFLCAHHCPFLHTCRLCPQDLQKTLLPTISNKELGLAADKIGWPVEEEIHKAMCINDIHKRVGVSHFVLFPH